MANIFTTDPNCVALWKFESGALVTDSIGTNTLTNYGVAEDAVNFKEGACAADFELADSDYMLRADADLSAGFPLKNAAGNLQYSFAFWIKFESITAITSIITKGSFARGMTLDITADGVLTLTHYASTVWNIATLVTGRWYHIGVSSDTAAKTAMARIWDDTAGSGATYTNTFSATLADTSSIDFIIGTYYNRLSRFFDGLIDELVVFNSVLTAADFDLIRAGIYGNPLLAGTIAAVASLQGNITGVSTLLEGTVVAVSTVTGELTGGALQLGGATADAVSGVTGDLTVVVAPAPIVIGSGTGGWAMGGAGVWASSTPTDTEIPAAIEPTGFYMGGGAEPGEAEVISTIPPSDEITPEGGFDFCGLGATGNAATTFPASDTIEAVAAFKFGGEGVWDQVGPEDLPRTVLVPTGGYVLGGTGLSLDPGVTPTTTIIVSTGGWVMGGRQPDQAEVTYPGNYDRIISEVAAFEMGGEGLPVYTYPESTAIASLGGVLALGGAGLCTSKMPPTTAIVTGEGGYILAGATPEEVFEAWCLSGQAFEPSVWSAFNFNSFAVKGGQAYAAGDAGIYLLGADYDAGEPINSGIRIGPINAGFDGEKRLRSIQFGSGGNGTSVRVRTDDGGEGVFKPGRDSNRVVVSRDIQGREMQIDVMGFEEISQFEMNFLRLARR